MDTKKSQDRKPKSSVRNRIVKKQYGPDKIPDGPPTSRQSTESATYDPPASSSEAVQLGSASLPSVVCQQTSNRSERDDADSAVWSEGSMPKGINLSGTQPHHSDNDADSAGCSEASMPRGIDLSDPQQHNLKHHKLLEGSCGICLGNIQHAVKHCKTCSVSYCETHVADHYKSPAFSSHELVDYKQTSRESLAKELSLQRSSSEQGCQPTGGSFFWQTRNGIWMLLIILSILVLALWFHHCYEDPVELPELRVMMLGKTGTGKSASGNTILGREAFRSEASALPVTKSCDSQSGVVEGRNITVIDTPAITTRQAAWLSEKVDPGPQVFLLVIRRAGLTKEDGEEVKWIQRSFGEEALKFTIILFTGGDQMDQKNAEEFLNESSGLQTLVNSTGGGYHIFDNKNPRGHGQVKGLLQKIELLLRKNMGYSYSHGLHEQVKTAVREEEERKRREEEEEEKRKMLIMQRDMQIIEAIKTMEKRIEQKIMEQMELKSIGRIGNATATLNDLREVVKATTDQGGNSLQEHVKTAEWEEEERKRREEEQKRKMLIMQRDIQINEAIKTMEKRIEQKIMEQMELKMIGRIANATAILNELREVAKATTEQDGNSLQGQVKTAVREEGATTEQDGNFIIYLFVAVSGLLWIVWIVLP